MKKYIIARITSTDNGTYGTIREQFKEPFAVTYELPWHDNKINISCIPPGRYLAKKAVYGRSKQKKYRYNSFIVVNVPGRTGIFLHIGNSIEDSRGCILMGELFDPVRLKKKKKIVPGIRCSKKGFNEFMGNLEKETEIEIEVKDGS